MFNFLKLSATKPQSEIAATETTSANTIEDTSASLTAIVEDAAIPLDVDETTVSVKIVAAVEAVSDDTKHAEESAETNSASDAVATDSLSTPTIEEYLNAHGFTVDYSRAGEYDLVCNSVKDIAEYIFENHEHISDFLGFLRIKLAKDGYVSYSMERLSPEAKETTIKFAKDILTPNGVLSNTYVNYTTNLITANIPGAKRIHSFIAGGWLEIIARQTVEEIVSKRAQELGVDYQVFSNLMVSKEGKLHELDVVFKLTNGRMCWIEAKSSPKYNDFNTFYQVGVDLATIPTYTLLLYPGADKHIPSICYFYDIHCCNLDKTLFISQINEMLNKSINN